MKKQIIILLLIFKISFVSAQTFEPSVIIEPTYPMVGDIIRVGVAHTLHPPCLTLPANNFQGLSHLFEYDGNNITLTAINDSFLIPICNPFPISPAIRAWYELGELSEGTYTLKTWISDPTLPLPVPSIYDPLVYGPILSFGVTTPISVDSLSIGWKLVYILLLIIITYFIKKRKFSLTK